MEQNWAVNFVSRSRIMCVGRDSSGSSAKTVLMLRATWAIQSPLGIGCHARQMHTAAVEVNDKQHIIRKRLTVWNERRRIRAKFPKSAAKYRNQTYYRGV